MRTVADFVLWRSGVLIFLHDSLTPVCVGSDSEPSVVAGASCTKRVTFIVSLLPPTRARWPGADDNTAYSGLPAFDRDAPQYAACIVPVNAARGLPRLCCACYICSFPQRSCLCRRLLPIRATMSNGRLPRTGFHVEHIHLQVSCVSG